MPNFEDLRLSDLIKKFRAEAQSVYDTRSLGKLSAAGEKLQAVYDFNLTAQNSFSEIEEELKNLFSSFNYAAVIVNKALKSGGLQGDDGELLNDCLEIMLRCCDKICNTLANKS